VAWCDRRVSVEQCCDEVHEALVVEGGKLGGWCYQLSLW